ncbi:MAG: DUF296 domain-containing protein [Pseudomonadota bacterium]
MRQPIRHLRQPGPTQYPRRLSASGAVAADLRLVLAPGSDLLSEIVERLGAIEIRHGAITILSGTLDELSYLTGQPDHSGHRVATYGAPTKLIGPVTLLGGNGILGLDQQGQALLHCHAIFADAKGRLHGGHLPPGACRIGSGGAVALVSAFDGAGFVVKPDPETNFSIFHPHLLSNPETKESIS